MFFKAINRLFNHWSLQMQVYITFFSVVLLINKIHVLHNLYVHAGQLLMHVKFLSLRLQRLSSCVFFGAAVHTSACIWLSSEPLQRILHLARRCKRRRRTALTDGRLMTVTAAAAAAVTFWKLSVIKITEWPWQEVSPACIRIHCHGILTKDPGFAG